jgi:hypothetical protein
MPGTPVYGYVIVSILASALSMIAALCPKPFGAQHAREAYISKVGLGSAVQHVESEDEAGVSCVSWPSSMAASYGHIWAILYSYVTL